MSNVPVAWVRMNCAMHDVDNLSEHFEVERARDAANRLHTVTCARALVTPIRVAKYVSKIRSGLEAKKRQRERNACRIEKQNAVQFSPEK